MSSNDKKRLDLSESKLLLTEHQIDFYVDSLKTLIPGCNVQKSMVYSFGDHSFHVTRYSHQGKPVMYVERGSSGDSVNFEKHYYLKDKNVALLTESSFTESSEYPFSYSEVFFKEGEVFFLAQRKGMTPGDHQAQPCRKTNMKPKINSASILAMFEDALGQRGKFDLVFEGITKCSTSKYLVFAAKDVDGFRAPVKVDRDDEFIRELSNNPMRYKGERLKISWAMSDKNQATYKTGELRRD